MTDLEKAREIASRYTIGYSEDDNSFEECYKSAIEMAVWKQEEMIEKLVEWWENTPFISLDDDGEVCVEKTKLLEDLKQKITEG